MSESITTPRWLSTGILTLLTLVAANLLGWRFVEPDLWGHIQYGEDWLNAGQMPLTATHTYTAPDFPWINHENLFELSIAVGQRMFGGLGLMILKCVAGLWLLRVMVRHAVRRQVPLMMAAVAMIPVAAGLAEFWLARPQLFSFLFFALMMLAFERAFGRRSHVRQVRTIWLWMCVPLIVVWTNSHGGFLAGLCVLLAMLAFRALEVVLNRDDQAIETKATGNVVALSRRRLVVEFGLIGLASIGAVFVNPYGWELPWWMLVSLSQPRPEVSEWANLADGGPAIFPFLALTFLTISSLILTRRRRDWCEIVVLALIAVQSIGHIRHLAFFALAFGFWMPEHLLSLWHRMVEWRPTLGEHPPMTARAARLLKVELSAAGVGLVGLLIWNFSQFGVDRSEYPVDAVEFMSENELQGRLVVTFDWAQYALAALNPQTTVGFDGRYDTCYPQHVVDMNFDLLFGSDLSRRHRGPDSGPVDSNRVLEYGSPDLVLVDRVADVPAVQHLDAHREWVPLYTDGRAALYGRKSVYDDPASAKWFAESRRVLSSRMPEGIAAWPAFPGRSGRRAFDPRTLQPLSSSGSHDVTALPEQQGQSQSRQASHLLSEQIR